MLTFPVHIKELTFTAYGIERTDPSFVQKLHRAEVAPEKADSRVRAGPCKGSDTHRVLRHQVCRAACRFLQADSTIGRDQYPLSLDVLACFPMLYFFLPPRNG